jgi:hypothetical protein
MRYVHKWHLPIVIKVYDSEEHFYYNPWYDPRHVPALLVDSVSDLGERWSSWIDTDASYGRRR